MENDIRIISFVNQLHYIHKIGLVYFKEQNGMEQNNLTEPFRYKIRNRTLQLECKCTIHAYDLTKHMPSDYTS